jgi:hypothetical protein
LRCIQTHETAQIEYKIIDITVGYVFCWHFVDAVIFGAVVRTLQGTTTVMLPFLHSLGNHKQKAFMQNITVHQPTVYDHQRKTSD